MGCSKLSGGLHTKPFAIKIKKDKIKKGNINAVKPLGYLKWLLLATFLRSDVSTTDFS